MIGEQAAEHRAERARGHEHDRGVALDDRPLARAQQIGDDGLRDRQQPAAADALQAARQDQKPDRRRQRAGDRTDDEDSDRRKHDGAAAVDVGELAEQRRRRGRREQIGRHHPGQIVDAAEAFADGRQRRRDDGLFERGEKHRQHDAEDDGARRGVIDRMSARPGAAKRRPAIRAMRGRPRSARAGSVGGNTWPSLGSDFACHQNRLVGPGIGTASPRINWPPRRPLASSQYRRPGVRGLRPRENEEATAAASPPSAISAAS